MFLLKIAQRTVDIPETNYNPPYFLLLIFFVLCLVFLVMVLVITIANWKLFEKAGEKGWKALIPIYGEWTRYKIALGYSPVMLFIMSLIPVIGLIPIFYVNYQFAYRYSRDHATGVLYCLFPFIVGTVLAFSKQAHYTRALMR